MAGGYLVAGFGTTYFGGNRDPGPFDLHASQNDPWERQIQHLRTLFSSLEWWKLEPHDELIKAPFERDGDSSKRAERNGRHVSVIAPPKRTYWLLADPGKTYVAYVRGHEGPYEIRVGASGSEEWEVKLFDPRSGRSWGLEHVRDESVLGFRLPDRLDWVVVSERRSR
jgi:hypothetical protein